MTSHEHEEHEEKCRLDDYLGRPNSGGYPRGCSGSPTALSEHDYIHISASQVSKRLRKLSEHGLLEPLGNGVYVTTPDGEKYLDGELAVEELDEKTQDGDEGAHAGT